MESRKKNRARFSNVSRLRNNSTNKSDNRISWIYLHKIASILRDLKHKETPQASLLTQNLKFPFLPHHTSKTDLQN